MLLDWIVITAADSGPAHRILRCFDSISWCSSMKAMHLNDNRTARARSIGDGTPPCKVCPRDAERASNSLPPSSWNILVNMDVEYTEEAASDLEIFDQLLS